MEYCPKEVLVLLVGVCLHSYSMVNTYQRRIWGNPRTHMFWSDCLLLFLSPTLALLDYIVFKKPHPLIVNLAYFSHSIRSHKD